MRPLDGICLRQSTNPATTGCPLAAKNCRQTHARASPRGEWRSHSNGRRVVAASVLVTKLRCPGGGNRMKKKCQARFRESPSKPARSQEVCPFAGVKFIATKKHKSARKSILALPLLVATPTRRRRPGHSSSLAFLASLAWDDFTQRAQSPRREVLGAALFVAFRDFSWQFQVARHSRRV